MESNRQRTHPALETPASSEALVPSERPKAPQEPVERFARVVRRLAIFLGGALVIFAGILMIVLPGPAFIVIPAGLAILATEFHWAHRLKVRLWETVGRPLKAASARFRASLQQER